MTSRGRRRGIFEGLPRLLYRRTAARYLEACAAAIVLNGVAVSAFGAVVVALYVDLSAGELARFAACSVAGFALEGAAAAALALRAAGAARAWLAGERNDPAAAWRAAATLPVVLLRRPSLYAVGAAGAGAPAFVLAGQLDLPARDALLLLPGACCCTPPRSSCATWRWSWRCARCWRRSARRARRPLSLRAFRCTDGLWLRCRWSPGAPR